MAKRILKSFSFFLGPRKVALVLLFVAALLVTSPTQAAIFPAAAPAPSVTASILNALENGIDAVLDFFFPPQSTSSESTEDNVEVVIEKTNTAYIAVSQYVTREEFDAALRNINGSVFKEVYQSYEGKPVIIRETPVTNVYNSTVINNSNGGGTSGLARSVSRGNAEQDQTIEGIQADIVDINDELANIAVASSSQWITSGSDIYYATGNVGIGTSTPESALSVVGDTTIAGDLILDTTSRKIQFSLDNWGSIDIGGVGLNLRSSSGIALVNAGSEVMRSSASSITFFAGLVPIFLDNSGSLGIGTTTPSTALQVVGTTTSSFFSGSGAGLTALNASNISSGILGISNGGTGTSTAPSLNQLLIGNGSGGYRYAATSTLGLVNSVSNSNGSLTISPTSGAVIASLNLDHANTWTADQSFEGTVQTLAGTFGNNSPVLGNSYLDTTLGGNGNFDIRTNAQVSIVNSGSNQIASYFSADGSVSFAGGNFTISSSATVDVYNQLNMHDNSIVANAYSINYDGSASFANGYFAFDNFGMIETDTSWGSGAILNGGGWGINTDGQGASSFGNDTLTISGGKVGVGTNNPQALLEVQNALGGELARFGTLAEEESGYINLQGFEDQDLKIGIEWQPGDGSSRSFINSANMSFDFRTDTISRLFLNKDTGNAGIGTTTPSQKLVVVGNGQFTAVGSAAAANDLRITAQGVLTTNTSDARLKENLEEFATSTLDKVLQLKPYYYTWIGDESGKRDLGFLAQDVAEIFPETTFINSTDGYMGINYSRFPAILVKAIQELSKQVADIRDGLLDTLRARNQICIDDVCVNKEQLKTLLEQAGTSGEQGGGDSSNEETPPSDSSPDSGDTEDGGDSVSGGETTPPPSDEGESPVDDGESDSGTPPDSSGDSSGTDSGSTE